MKIYEEIMIDNERLAVGGLYKILFEYLPTSGVYPDISDLNELYETDTERR